MMFVVLVLAGNYHRLQDGVNSIAKFYWRTSKSSWKTIDLDVSRNDGCLVTIDTDEVQAM
jgi:hypothetical protein